MGESVSQALHAIPTLYRGVQMRSRIEARWAAMFDELRWPWLYEPFDLAGYIPDFVLRFADADILVEVKPYLRVDALITAQRKIDDTEWEGEALVLLGGIDRIDSMQPVIGMSRDPNGWDLAALFVCTSCKRVSLLNLGGSWHCRVCGAADGNSHVGPIRAGDGIAQLWAQCGNKVQWRPE